MRLNLASEPEWLELVPGVRVLVEPLGTALMVAARSDADVQALGEDASTEEAAVIFAKAIARLAIREWEGVEDTEGNALPVSREAVDALLEIFPAFEAFQALYVAPGLVLEQEKNASAPLPSGSSAGAGHTVNTA